MADNITLKRIVDLVAQTDVDETVYTIIDSVAGTVKKYPIGSLICSIAPIFDTTAAYAAGKYCNYNGQLYRFDEAHAAGSWTGSDATAVTLSEFLEAIGPDVDDLKEALTDVSATLTHKADKDGTVASAEQLLSDVGTEDKVPYLFRATPYDSTRVDEELVGCSVGWNQLVQNGNFADGTAKWSSWNGTIAASDGILTLTATSAEKSIYAANRNVNIVSGHKYYIRAEVKTSVNTDGTKLAYTTSGSGIKTVACTANTWTTIEAVFNATSSTDTIMVYLDNTTARAVGDTLQLREVVLVDTTAWFGSTIADYDITLEQATAGSGVAWIKALLPDGYIPFSAPKMESVSGLSGHKFTGFNAWDEDWELGYYDNLGKPQDSTAGIRGKNYIPVIPGKTYYAKSSGQYLYVCQYDANHNFINSRDGYIDNVFTVGSNCRYIRINMASAYGATYNHDICINLSDPARNGQYEPYKATTYALDSDLTLRGILKMDSDHRVYADGDVYKSDGTVTRNWAEYGVSELDTTMTTVHDNPVWLLRYNVATAGSDEYTATSNILVQGTYNQLYRGDKNIICQNSQGRLYASIDGVTDAASLATWLQAHPSFTVLAKLATPTTETADPYASPQNCEPGGTEEYVYAEGGSGVPVGHNSRYQKNLKGELERVMVAVPDAPGQNGTYSLKATVTSSGVTYAWTSD